MISALAADGKRADAAAALEKRLAVFGSQYVVGGGEQRAVAERFLQRPLPRGRIAQPVRERQPERLRKHGRGHGLGRADERRGVAGLTAEAKRVHCAKPVKDLHCAARKALGRGKCARDGKLEHEACAAFDRRAGANGLVKQRRRAALDKIAAHQADDGRAAAEPLPCHAKLLFMAQMEWIVLTDDADSRHGAPPWKILRKALVSVEKV